MAFRKQLLNLRAKLFRHRKESIDEDIAKIVASLTDDGGPIVHNRFLLLLRLILLFRCVVLMVLEVVILIFNSFLLYCQLNNCQSESYSRLSLQTNSEPDYKDVKLPLSAIVYCVIALPLDIIGAVVIKRDVTPSIIIYGVFETLEAGLLIAYQILYGLVFMLSLVPILLYVMTTRLYGRKHLNTRIKSAPCRRSQPRPQQNSNQPAVMEVEMREANPVPKPASAKSNQKQLSELSQLTVSELMYEEITSERL